MGALPKSSEADASLKIFDGDSRHVPPPSCPARALATHHAHLHQNGAWGTAIGREWAEKRFPTCGGLCEPDDCRFSNGFCLVPVDKYVPEESCRDFSKRASGT